MIQLAHEQANAALMSIKEILFSAGSGAHRQPRKAVPPRPDLTWIKVRVFGLDEDRTSLNSDVEIPMANTPVEVKKTAPAKAPDAWHSFRDEMNRLFDRFSGGFGMPALRRLFDAEPTWTYESSFSFPTPAVDVTEDEKAYKITAELPGLAEKEISVAVSGDMLTIKGEKSYEKEEKNKDRHVSERAYGSFQRSFTVPDGVDRDKIAADLAKGVLTITLPKSAQAQKQQKIEVKAAA